MSERWVFALMPVLFVLSGCVHVDEPTLDEVACLGHRGHVTETTFENTHDAFLAAYNLGADGTEMDIYHTRDDIAVVFHDKNLSRLTQSKPGESCPKSASVGDLSHADLQRRCVLTNGDDIPTLESVLQRFSHSDFILFLEFKDPIQRRTVKLIDRYYPTNGSEIVGTSFLRDIVKAPFQSFSLGFPLNLAHREYVTGMETGFDGVDVGAISEVDVQRLRQRGKRIGVYGVNTVHGLNRALDFRVDTITTDALTLCVELKQEKLNAQN